MPRFLITLISFLTIAGAAVGKTHRQRPYATGRVLGTITIFKNGDDSSVVRRLTTFGSTLPRDKIGSLVEYVEVESDYRLPERELVKSDSCVFPVFAGFEDTTVEDKINGAIFRAACALWQIEDTSDIMRALELAKQNDYHCTSNAVTNWDSALISVQLYTYYEGAYPNDLPLYFNFNAATGNLLTLDSMIVPEQMPRFQKLLRGKLKHILNAYRPDLARQLRTGDIDSDAYHYCIDATRGDGMGTFDPRAFIVSPDTIKVELDWGFMHALQALAPESEIALSKKELKGILKKEYE